MPYMRISQYSAYLMPVRIRHRSIIDAIIGFLCTGNPVIGRVSICTAITMPVCIYDDDLGLIISTYYNLGYFLCLIEHSLTMYHFPKLCDVFIQHKTVFNALIMTFFIFFQHSL